MAMPGSNKYLFMYSCDESSVGFANIILKLKDIDIYKGKGIFVRGTKFKLKEIKKK